MKPRTLAYDAARALPVYPRWPAYAIGILAAVTILTGFAGIPWVPSHALLLLVVVAVPVTGWWFAREVLPAQSTDGVMTRSGDREQRAGGVASVWDVMEKGSPAAVRGHARVLRPGLALTGTRLRAQDAGFLIATTGLGLRHGQQLWSTIREATLTVGVPGTGKTQFLSCLGLDAQGAVVTTSTQLDLAQNMHQVRRVYPETVQWRRTWRRAWLTKRPDWSTGIERDVHIFNPTGIGDAWNTVRWNARLGCRDFLYASRRAQDFIATNSSHEGENWDRKARTSLAIMLLAADVAGRSVSDINGWVGAAGSNDTLPNVRRELTTILVNVDGGEELIRTLTSSLLAVNDRTRSSITQAMAAALAWTADPVARDIGDADPTTVNLDIRRLITGRETLHIIGSDVTGSPLAPLTSALVAEVADVARTLAAEQVYGERPDGTPNRPGRVDPPVTLVLDEATKATRLPLPDWTAFMGGRGVTIHMAVQSLSQLREAWGDAAGSLLGNIGTTILFGGGMDADDLRRYSRMCGYRQRRVVNGGEDIDGDGEKWERVPVMDEAQLSNMKPGQAAIRQRNLGGLFVGRPPQARFRHGWEFLSLTAPTSEPGEAVRSSLAGESSRVTDTTEEQSA